MGDSAKTAAAPLQGGLVRGLGLLDATTLIVGSVIGSGIFVAPSIMAGYVQSPPLLLGLWLVGGALTLFGALAYGELAAALPRAGGQYVFLGEAFGPLWGFLYGWTLAVAMSKALFAYDAWNSITFAAEEVKDPETNLPRSLLLGTVGVTLVYCAAVAIYLYMVPISEMFAVKDNRIAAETASRALGAGGAAF